MKYLIATLMLLLTTFTYGMNDAIVLHPKLSYRLDNENLDIKDYHLFGDRVSSSGETKIFKESEYVYTEKEGEKFLTYSYFVIQDAMEGVILQDSFIYSSDDLSTITDRKVGRLTFVAMDKKTVNKKLIRISYLNRNDNGWYISTGWVKNSSVSDFKDDWSSAVKYFIASQEKDEELRKTRLESILKFNKKTIFKDQIIKMIEDGHLKVNEDEYDLDRTFAGTGSFLNVPYEGKILSEPDSNSQVVFEGTSEIKLVKRLSQGSEGKIWYYVETPDNKGWILK